VAGGEAVAIGMARAARLAVLLRRVPRSLIDRQDSLLTEFSLPTAVPAGGIATADTLLDIMRRDKKSVAGSLRFVLPDRLGHVELVEGIPADLVRQSLAN